MCPDLKDPDGYDIHKCDLTLAIPSNALKRVNNVTRYHNILYQLTKNRLKS